MGTPAPSDKPSPLGESLSEFSPAVPESILFLRVARGMIVPLRTSSDAAQPAPQVAVRIRAVGTQALAVPFRVSKTVVDPATKIKVSVGFNLECALISEAVRLGVECDPVPKDPIWKVSLRDAAMQEELARIPILQHWEALDTKLPYGFYMLELSSDEHTLCRFTFTVEPFSLPEALDVAQEYLAHSQYGRAVVILEEAGARYPDSAEVWDLLSVVEELAALDPEAVEHEEQEFGAFRGPQEWFSGVGTVLQKMRSKFGESVASLLVARKHESASVSDALLGKVTELPVSLSALRALALLKERLKAADDETKLRDERLAQALAGVSGRLGQLETLTLDLGERIDAIRAKPDSDAEEKFSLVGELLIRFLDGTHSAGVSLPEYAPFFQEKLGEACWKWIGLEAQRMFVSAEDVYRYFASSTTTQTRDFTPALIEFCRGFELLLNSRLGKFCEAIRNLVSGNSQLQEFVKQKLTWANVNDTIAFKKSYSIAQVAMTLRLGEAVRQSHPEFLNEDVGALHPSSGLSDHESISVLSHIGLIFRNGKVHPYPGSGRMLTSAKEVQILRKLLFGFDEERVNTHAFFSEFYGLRIFTRAEIQEAADSLSHSWSQFPGLIPRFWRTAESGGAVLKAVS